jgi:hypothetical protein
MKDIGKKIWALVQRVRSRTLVTPSIVRFLIPLALLLISVPPLYRVFAETREPTKRTSVRIATDCFNKFSVDQYLSIDSAGDATINLKMRPTGVLADECKTLTVNIPGRIASFYPRNASELAASVGIVTFKLDQLDQSDFFDRDIPISVSGRIPHALVKKTFTKRIFYFDFFGGATGTVNVGKLQAQEPWRIETLIDLDPVYDLTDYNRNLYHLDLDQRNHTILSFVGNDGFAEMFFLENGDSTSKRELQILYSGAMIGTAFAIFAEFLIGLVGSRRRRL